MGFPYEPANWAIVDGAMFMGWGGSAPGLYTAVAIIICTLVLVIGNSSEQKKYKKVEK